MIERETLRNETLIARLDSKDKSDFRFPDISDGEVVLLQGICCLLLLLLLLLLIIIIIIIII